MYQTTKKRSRHASNRYIEGTCAEAFSTATNNSRRTNRTIFSTALLTLATLVFSADTAIVVSFTPNSSGRASLSTGQVASPIVDINNKKDTVAIKTAPSSTKRRRHHQTQQQTIAESDHGVSIMASPILHQQRKNRLSPHQSKSVLVVDDEVFHHSTSRKNKNDLSLQLLFKNDFVRTTLHSRTGRLVSTDLEQNRNPTIIHHSSRDGSAPKKRSSKSLDSSSTPLLTRDEERQITYRIRDLRRVVQIRDEMFRRNADTSFTNSVSDFPSEQEWAEACDLDVLTLRKIMSEGQDARSTLVSANAGLVKTIAKRNYYVLKQMTTAGGGVGTILTLQDMIQEGNLGLMKAAERFEPERGFRFSTYATYWIRQRILQSITDSSRVIRLPVHVTETLKKLNRARKEISAEIGRMPSDVELAHHMDISVEKLRRLNDKARSVISLESPLRMASNHRSEMDLRTIGDFIASDAPTPEEDAEHKSLQQDIRAVVNELAEREREVLIMRFGLDGGGPMSTSETAAQLGITRDRVRHVETRALNKLRNPQRNYRLKDYLGEGHYAAVEGNQQRSLSKPPVSKKKSKRHVSSVGKTQRKPLAHEKFWFF